MSGREEAESEPVEDGAVDGIGYGAVAEDEVVQSAFKFIGCNIRSESRAVATDVFNLEHGIAMLMLGRPFVAIDAVSR